MIANVSVAEILFDVVWGMLLGGMFFGGLWLNVKRIPANPKALWLVPLSFLVRMTLLLGGIAWVGGGQPVEVMAIVVGLLIARRIVITAVTSGQGSTTTKRNTAIP